MIKIPLPPKRNRLESTNTLVNIARIFGLENITNVVMLDEKYMLAQLLDLYYGVCTYKRATVAKGGFAIMANIRVHKIDGSSVDVEVLASTDGYYATLPERLPDRIIATDDLPRVLEIANAVSKEATDYFKKHGKANENTHSEISTII